MFYPNRSISNIRHIATDAMDASGCHAEDPDSPKVAGGSEPEVSPFREDNIRLVKTAAGQTLYTNAVAQAALEHCDWVALLGAAPAALGRLGQCFAIAADPRAATLTVTTDAGLP